MARKGLFRIFRYKLKQTVMGVLVAAAVLGLLILANAWREGIDYMKDNHPDYKGEDFLSEDKEDKKK